MRTERRLAEEAIRKTDYTIKKLRFLRNRFAGEGNDVGNLSATLIGECLYAFVR